MKPRDFLPPWTPKLNVAVVEAAFDDLGMHEDPPGSNRGAFVDAVNQRFGSPLGSPWCANVVGKWLQTAGAAIPPDTVGSAERWHRFALHNGLFTHDAQPGSVVIYGDAKTLVASHLGIVEQIVRRTTLTIEGNTTVIPGYEREGWIVQQKEVNAERLLGYMELRAVGSLA